MNINDLELTVRSNNALAGAGITTVEELVQLDWMHLRRITNIGDKSVSEIAWTCVQLLNGNLFTQRIAWEKRFPEQQVSWQALIERANKYDEIVSIVSTQTALKRDKI